MKTALIMALSAALVVVVGIACTSLGAGGDAGACSAPTAGQTGCVLPLLAKNLPDWPLALQQAHDTCGVPSPVAQSIWDAHVQAETLEGFVPRAIGSDGGIRPQP
jgi:hypothetical protein